MLAVLLVVLFEVWVCFDRLNGRSPCGLPVVGDVQDRLHEDLKVDKNSAPEIFTNVVVVIFSVEFLDPVRIAFLPLTHR